MAHLQLDQARIDRARNSARRIAGRVFDEMDHSTTTTVERSTLRLMGLILTTIAVQMLISGVRVAFSLPPQPMIP